MVQGLFIDKVTQVGGGGSHFCGIIYEGHPLRVLTHLTKLTLSELSSLIHYQLNVKTIHKILDFFSNPNQEN